MLPTREIRERLAHYLPGYLLLPTPTQEAFERDTQLGQDLVTIASQAQIRPAGGFTGWFSRPKDPISSRLDNLSEIDAKFYAELNTYIWDGIIGLVEDAAVKKLLREHQKIEAELFFPRQLQEASLTLSKSLSSFLQRKDFQRVHAFIKRLAATHGLIQYMGFATQNEASWMAGLDFYNYCEYAAELEQARGVLASIGRLFYPLYREYRDIAQYEKNSFFKLIRVLMPVVIPLILLVLALTLLSFLGVPELALFFVAIPVLFLGLYSSTLYVLAKDSVYHKIRTLYYGDEYALPEFQLNDRLRLLFGAQAKSIRDFYIALIKEAKQKESKYRAQIVLTVEEKEDRDENQQDLLALQVEWLDIHNNVEAPREEVLSLVRTRVTKFYNRSLAAFKKEYHSPIKCFLQPLQEAYCTGKAPASDPSYSKTFWSSFWTRRARLEEVKALSPCCNGIA